MKTGNKDWKKKTKRRNACSDNFVTEGISVRDYIGFQLLVRFRPMSPFQKLFIGIKRHERFFVTFHNIRDKWKQNVVISSRKICDLIPYAEGYVLSRI